MKDLAQGVSDISYSVNAGSFPRPPYSLFFIFNTNTLDFYEDFCSYKTLSRYLTHTVLIS